ncbi:pyruvate dehydrogenase (acetyl-transferring) E1 component subunit alpha [Microbacterium esteraromaticum]|uniref:Pyruvate dehydrogenase (Acetyl-transferring) E1 component subunit alpha n=1 Tax=Microbacterium esteraromaticum TaxID=57043 RepID=A0A939DX98_9MICO|nr:pyruvate dehydrogenase (acetyl-transferring) E1 component subunit alpha [Microbacterium esteraromaticum]MBN7792658.1 pyruvate dehydrogenase (acetyl-transferring) E1 component subunit alpha [Microbacterium esteraromaticum]MBN8206074.1 pyruvate dehydrogenase (acetyl-transferring) E1 component subunit alpha [Microbacterium esteraromaticum]MBN8416229.1 pyruvate dehydrogenase (acetyl-transferring) E1 component subunit alpha [Microbacterium esteraromaticum]MCA1306233.1 pyruvate dehydrogenase (acet
MSPHTTPIVDTENDLTERIIAPNGSRLSNPQLDRYVQDVDFQTLRDLHRDMVVVRRIDSEGVALQRQGQLGLWAPCNGQEAAQVGTARALEKRDYVFPSYRETGVMYARGAAPGDYARMWRGEEGSAYDPDALRIAPLQIIIGAQTLHAVGYGMGIMHDGADEVAVSYFGDGATSQGDVNEAMVFASSYRAPVVFVCQNNHWAISEPVGLQSQYPLAGRAPGFGIPSMRVDGNDVLACLAAMRWALEHARSGKGPAYLEAVTYRMGPHTTADDPKRYRDDAELALWRERDPIARLEAHLRAAGELPQEHLDAVQAEADAVARDMRAATIGMVTRPALAVFDGVYAEPHSGIERQRAEYAAYLAAYEEA